MQLNQRSRQIYARNPFDFQTDFSDVLDFLLNFSQDYPVKSNQYYQQNLGTI